MKITTLVQNLNTKDQLCARSQKQGVYPRTEYVGWLIAVLGTCLYVLQAASHASPLGFAGLYSLFAETLAKNHFAIPASIPFYGPGGFPAVYPPLAFYLMAAVCGLGHVPVSEYLRFAPAIFSGFALVPFFLVSYRISSSQLVAAVSGVFLATSPIVAYFQLTSGGVVRALGFLFAWLTVWAFVQAQNGKSLKWIIAVPILFGLSITTHISYALFTGIGLFSLALFSENKISALKLFFITAIGGTIVSSPWWINVLLQHGLSTLLLAFSSHGASGFLDLFSHPIQTLYMMGYYFLTAFKDCSPVTIMAVTVGFGLALIYPPDKKNRILLIWCALEIVFQSENSRFLFSIFAMLCGIGIVGLSEAVRIFLTPPLGRVFSRFVLIGCLIVVITLFLRYQLLQTSYFTQSTLDLAGWVQMNTKLDDKYLFTSNDEDWAEWLPYVTARTPILGHWGSEWLGTYYSQREEEDELQACSIDGLRDQCVEDFIVQHNFVVTYLIT